MPVNGARPDKLGMDLGYRAVRRACLGGRPRQRGIRFRSIKGRLSEEKITTRARGTGLVWSDGQKQKDQKDNCGSRARGRRHHFAHRNWVGWEGRTRGEQGLMGYWSSSTVRSSGRASACLLEMLLSCQCAGVYVPGTTQQPAAAGHYLPR